MRKYLIIVLLCLIYSVSLCQNKSLLIGDWKYVTIKIENPSATNEKIKERIKLLNKQKIWLDCDILSFGLNNSFKRIRGNKIVEPNDRMEYRLKNINGEEDENGSIIFPILFKRDGSIYNGTNMIGPFEIVSITNNILILRFRYDYRVDSTSDDYLLISYTKMEN